MSDSEYLKPDHIALQMSMFAMFVGQGKRVTREALFNATGIPKQSLANYAHGAAMPFDVARRICKVLPEAINMLLEPDGLRIVPIEVEDTNWHEVGSHAAHLTYEILNATKDGAVDHVEKARLQNEARELTAKLSAAVRS